MPKKRTNRTKQPPQKPRGKTAITRRGKWRVVFLVTLAKAGNITDAIRAANVSRDTVYAHRGKDKDFAKGWDDALEEWVDHLKVEAHRRAVEGTDVPVTHEGQLCFVTINVATNKYVPADEAMYFDPATRQALVKPGYQRIPFTKKQYSDALLMMLLKSGRPSEFGDKLKVDANMTPADPITIDVLGMVPKD